MARKNHKQISVPRIVTPIALAITLAACSSKPPAPQSVDITSAPAQSVEAYLIKADSSQGSIQNDWLIMALKAAIESGDTQQASLIINRLEKQNLSITQLSEWKLLRAQNDMALERYEVVLQELYFEPWWELDNTQWVEYHNIRGEAFDATGDYFNSSVELNELYSISPEQEQELIASKIWENLSQYSELDLNNFQAKTDDWNLRGWISLSLYMNVMRSNVSELKSTLESWFTENPQHPAATYTPDAIKEILNLEIIEPKKTALLLPITGRYEKQGKLVRDGFLFALLQDSMRDKDATLTVIDTNKLSAEEINAKLTSENIDFVVGPLVKSEIEDVQAVLDTRAEPIPMLALNFPEDLADNPGYCYLTLSPEQEVSQAAKHLSGQGFKYPLILAPKGALGKRVTDAFQKEWAVDNKTEVEVAYFGSKAQLQQTIDTVFGLKSSQARIVQMDNLLKTETENQPRSRRDIDSVYIVARSSELTLIKPFIEVAINPEATPPKLFSNSRSNSGKRQFEDLSGVVYSDIPLLVEDNEVLNTQMSELWPEQSNGQKRLHALGMDAYQLITELPKMQVVPDYRVHGKTGVLSMGEQCIIQREVDWAEYDAL
ncbi:penicillin-binding protein activator [Vibrio hannami]|uniref:penicillin-binding protein activator n=1 Tax=Vibrio hannami TaxID=2717094 RepID=UPI00240EDF8E|nr:penicillin-binding protein activator [Vibrio hannami]MDG3089070.1 penicillin-binding protein activator [Vibrio hannami]